MFLNLALFRLFFYPYEPHPFLRIFLRFKMFEGFVITFKNISTPKTIKNSNVERITREEDCAYPNPSPSSCKARYFQVKHGVKSSSATDQFLKKLVLMVYILMLGHNGPDCQDPYELKLVLSGPAH